MKTKLKMIFRPICWFQEVFYTIFYNKFLSGHDFIGDDPFKDLTCEVCGYVSKGKG